MATITTFTGREVDPFKLKWRDIDIFDIAHALAMICRFCGHCRLFYSVAQHSVLVSSLCPPELAREGLLHDAPEAYLGDIPTPLKDRFGEYRDAETRAHVVIGRCFGIPGTITPAVKEADREAFRIEKAYLIGRIQPAGIIVPFTCLSPEAAEALFLARYAELSSN
jgi:hypothetical protein